MTRHEFNATTIADALEHLTERGFEGMARAVEILLNEAMKLERSEFLGAGPYERNAQRQGYANGFKPKRVKTRVGELQLAVPKARELGPDVEPFYPSALERGLRSERALTLAVAEMYVQGVSTRKVAEVTRELCGLDITSQHLVGALRHPCQVNSTAPVRTRAKLVIPHLQRLTYAGYPSPEGEGYADPPSATLIEAGTDGHIPTTSGD